MLIYVIARSDKMKAHQVSDARQQEIASIAELADLKDRGILTDAEFQRIKGQRQLSQEPPPSPDDDIAELESLKDRGLLTEEEFQSARVTRRSWRSTAAASQPAISSATCASSTASTSAAS